jgi:hypothetical protein
VRVSERLDQELPTGYLPGVNQNSNLFCPNVYARRSITISQPAASSETLSTLLAIWGKHICGLEGKVPRMQASHSGSRNCKIVTDVYSSPHDAIIYHHHVQQFATIYQLVSVGCCDAGHWNSSQKDFVRQTER